MNGSHGRMLIAGLGVALLAPAPCFAQFGNSGPPQSGPGSATQRMMRGGAPAPKTDTTQPAALPGARPGAEPALPTQAPADMSPTEALFDAINRGDTAAARDAVNRGANLNGHNLLGLTPLELSVDLARNNISFLLLSMRGQDSSLGRDADRRDNGQTRGAARPVARPRVAAAPPRGADPRAPDPRASEPPRAVAAPRLYSGGGGTPIPNAGFLGFDGGRSVQ